MKSSKTVLAVLAMLMAASLAFSQGNARTEGLGAPNVDGRNLIDDPSDIFYFPSEVAASTEMAQGVANSYVYISRTLTGSLTMGFLLAKPTYSGLNGVNFYGAYTGALGDANTYFIATTSANSVPGFGDFNVAGITAPPGVAHLLLGLNLSDALKLGLDASYERSNMTVDETAVTVVAPNSETITSKGSSTLSALGVNAGVQLNVAMLKIKGAVGFVNLGFAGKMEHGGSNSVNLPATYNHETSELIAAS